jgi:hypothetical protein
MNPPVGSYGAPKEESVTEKLKGYGDKFMKR